MSPEINQVSNGKNNKNSEKKYRNQFIANLVAGATHATLSTLSGYPFDFVKGRTQAQPHLYKSSFDCMNKSYKSGGILTFYKGSLSPWINHMIKRPIQFSIAEPAKIYLTNKLDGKTNTCYINYIVGASTGIVGPLYGTPLQVVKVSMQTTTNPEIKNSFQLIKHILKTDGFIGFYRGFNPTVMKDIVYSGSFLGTYLSLRDYFGCDIWWKNSMNGILAHCFTWCVFMPFDYIKTNSQKYLDVGEKKLSIYEIVKRGYNIHGITGFWRGIIPACSRAVAISGVSLAGYEKVRQLVTDKLNN